jgi:YrbI family 3-deoxy-D-manno-octulosonate 8-phosphate phosphatase
VIPSADTATAIVLNAGPLAMRRLCGKPLLAHTIDIALASKPIVRTIVHTTDPDESALAKSMGCTVHSGSLDSIAPDGTFVFLSGSYPIRSDSDIEAALGHIRSADAVIAAVRLEDRVWSHRRGAGGAQRIDSRDPWYRQTFSLAVGVGPAALRNPFAPAGRVALHEMDTDAAISITRPAHFHSASLVLRERLRARAMTLLAPLRMLVLDFDGVLTDNRVLVSETGQESILANRSDGLGLGMLRKAGVKVAVLSAETNPVVARRCEKLKLDFVQGVENKIESLDALLSRNGVNADQAAYMGNDVNDLACMARCAVSIAPADAHPDVLAAAHLVTERSGGAGTGGIGAAREVADWFVASRSATPNPDGRAT